VQLTTIKEQLKFNFLKIGVEQVLGQDVHVKMDQVCLDWGFKLCAVSTFACPFSLTLTVIDSTYAFLPTLHLLSEAQICIWDCKSPVCSYQ